MGFSLVLATLLCSTTWMTSVDATHGPAMSCCMKVSTTTPPLNRIMNYTIQTDSGCPIKAIVFLTIQGRRICSDPTTPWAQRAKNKVDKETKALQVNGQNEEGSTSDIVTPASATATIKAPQKERPKTRTGWRRLRKKVRHARRCLRKRA